MSYNDYPKTLTILIKTRIRGNSKIKYEPSMSIPGIKADKVYFDPLIKLNKRVVSNIPPGYPPSEVYTQFFNKDEFDSLINRTISTSFFGQSHKNVNKAAEEGIIDENIKIVLNQLFKPGSQFYLRGQPYTIFKYDWTQGDWRVDTKSFENKFRTNEYGYGAYFQYQISKQEEAFADKELDEFQKHYPNAVKGKVSKKMSKFYEEGDIGLHEISSDVASGIKPEPGRIPDQPQPGPGPKPVRPVPTYHPIKKKRTIFTNRTMQAKIPKPAKTLLGVQYIFEPFFQSDEDVPNIQNDPISLSIIYVLDRNYSTETEKNAQVNALYTTFLEMKQKFNRAQEQYSLKLGLSSNRNEEGEGEEGSVRETDEPSVLQIKGQYDDAVDSFLNELKRTKTGKISLDEILHNKNTRDPLYASLGRVLTIRNHFLSYFKEVLIAFLNKVQAQDHYIKAFIPFYNALHQLKKKELDVIEKNAQKQSIDKFLLIITTELLQFDASCFRSILQNKYYVQQMNNLKQTIQEYIVELDAVIAIQYTIQDEFKKIYNRPILLQIEKIQYDSYYEEIFLLNETNEYIMWNSISSETDTFFERIKAMALKKIESTFILLQKYNEKYTPAQRIAFMTRLEAGSQPLQSQSMTQFTSFSKNVDKEQKLDYIQLKNSEVICYDLITLYTRISSICLARQISYLTVQNNLNKIKINKMGTMKKYYALLQNNMQYITGLIPRSIFWETAQLYNTIDVKIQENESVQSSNIIKNIYIEDKIQELNVTFNEAVDLLIPRLTDIGILQKCYEITESGDSVDSGEQEKLTTNEMIVDTFFNNFIKNEDTELTEMCKSQWMVLMKEQLRENRTNTITPSIISKKLNTWRVSGEYRVTDRGRTYANPSLFQCIVTAFNGQLVLLQKITLNPYARKPTSLNPYVDSALPAERATEYKFTISQLRKAVSDGITDKELKKYTTVAQEFIRGFFMETWIEYTMDYENTPQIFMNMILSVIQKKWTPIQFMFKQDLKYTLDYISKHCTSRKSFEDCYAHLIHADLNTVKEIIRQNTGENGGKGTYYGDEITVHILERIFKINIVTIDIFQKPLDIFHLKKNVGKSVLIRDKKEDADTETEIVGVITKILESKKIMEYTNDMSEDKLRFYLMMELYFLYKLYELIKHDIEYYTQNTQKPGSSWNMTRREIYHNIGILIQQITVQNMCLPLKECMFFINIFVDRSRSRFYFLNESELKSVILKEDTLRDLNARFNKLHNLSENFYPKYQVQTPGYKNFKIGSDRLIEIHQPYFNIAKNGEYPSGAMELAEDFENSDDWEWLFLLRRYKPDDDIFPIYKNIYNFSDKTFLYKMKDVPDMFRYLYFRSFTKFHDIQPFKKTSKTMYAEPEEGISEINESILESDTSSEKGEESLGSDKSLDSDKSFVSEDLQFGLPSKDVKDDKTLQIKQEVEPEIRQDDESMWKNIEETDSLNEAIQQFEKIEQDPSKKKDTTKLNIQAIRNKIFTRGNPEKQSQHNIVDSKWLQKIMKDDKYYIVDNGGGGDCFFFTIKDAFKTVGQITDMNRLRTALSEYATRDVYKIYKDFYRNNSDANNLRFMNGIKSFQEFKEALKTRQYWGDTFAVTSMEDILNIKFIIIDEGTFYRYNRQQRSIRNGNPIKGPIIKKEEMFICNQSDFKYSLDKSQSFIPDYYIIISYTGNHFKLIGYNGRQIFKFDQIPEAIKNNYAKRCMSDTSEGGFNMIPDFLEYKHGLPAIGGGRNNGILARPPFQMDEYNENYSKLNNQPVVELPTLTPLNVDEQRVMEKERQRGGGTVLESGHGGAMHISSPYQRNSSFPYGTKESKLSFYVIIDLELYPGKEGIPVAQKLVLACQSRYEKIRQSWAKMFGLVYRPTEMNTRAGFIPRSGVSYHKKREEEKEEVAIKNKYVTNYKTNNTYKTYNYNNKNNKKTRKR